MPRACSFKKGDTAGRSRGDGSLDLKYIGTVETGPRTIREWLNERHYNVRGRTDRPSTHRRSN